MNPNFHGKTALVTGGSRGIGKAVVEALQAQGCRVAVLARKPETVSCALPLVCDVAQEEQQLAACGRIKEEFGGLDYAFINAGINHFAPLLDMPTAHWDEVLQVNLRGAYISLRESARLMKESGGGSILCCASLTSLRPERGVAPYAAAKAALAMLCRVAAQELGEHGIRVNAVAPGFTRTDLTEPALQLPGYGEKLARNTPLGRIGEVGDIAPVVLGVLGMEWVTGQLIVADGGFNDRSLSDFFDAAS